MLNDEEHSTNQVDGFLPAQIEAQVDKIIHSRIFKTSTQMQNFLRYVVDKKLPGVTASLKQYAEGHRGNSG